MYAPIVTSHPDDVTTPKAADWISQLFNLEINEANLFEHLMDGVLLCKLAAKVTQGEVEWRGMRHSDEIVPNETPFPKVGLLLFSPSPFRDDGIALHVLCTPGRAAYGHVYCPPSRAAYGWFSTTISRWFLLPWNPLRL